MKETSSPSSTIIISFFLYYMIAGSPILSNPSISKNATHHTLMWSPPFLWPGHRIQHYNVSMTNIMSNGSILIVHYRVDTSITSPIVTASFPMSWSLINDMLSCTKFTFSISPIDGSVLEPMKTFNVSDWAWTFPAGKLHFKLVIRLYTSYLKGIAIVHFLVYVYCYRIRVCCISYKRWCPFQS